MFIYVNWNQSHVYLKHSSLHNCFHYETAAADDITFVEQA